ncbi:MAG: AMP-binding protein [Spirochaetaceae bacterium]|nr:AMP-binding protein [Spirochaetaceae bacterium]
MSKFTFYTPWVQLDNYRGKFFNDKWPTIPQLLALNAYRYADKIAFSTFEDNKNLRTYSYYQVKLLVDNIAGYFIEKGIKKGDNIVLSGANSLEWAAAFIAIMQAGAVAIPLDNGMSSEKALAITKRVKAKMLICDHNKLAKGFDKAGIPTYSLTQGTANYVLNLKNHKAQNFPVGAMEDIAAILFTSGTTGNEKGVILTQRALVGDAFLAQSLIKVYPSDIAYVLLPMHHSYCLTAVFIISLTAGMQLLFTDKIAISHILHDLKAGKVTCLLGVPMLYNKVINGIMSNIKKSGPLVTALVKSLLTFSGFINKVFKVNIGGQLPILKGILGKASLSTLRVLISGGGPIAAETLSTYRNFGLNMTQGYGLTETGPIITVNPPHAYRSGSVGRVLPETDIVILQPNNEGIGEIAVKGPMLFEGYYSDNDATVAVFTADGYFKTGDLGWKDKDNYIYITGRAKNMIVSEGGKNVYPEEVEDVFQLDGEFEQLLVRGYVSDEKLKTEAIEAVVYPNAELFKGQNLDNVKKRVIELVRAGNKKLRSYQQIKRIRLVSKPLAISSTNKIKRFTTASDEGEVIYG